jgi:hypothetical protein
MARAKTRCTPHLCACAAPRCPLTHGGEQGAKAEEDEGAEGAGGDGEAEPAAEGTGAAPTLHMARRLSGLP